jgi:hypothetical protein
MMMMMMMVMLGVVLFVVISIFCSSIWCVIVAFVGWYTHLPLIAELLQKKKKRLLNKGK